MIPDTTGEQILRESLNVSQTDGEWELIDVQIAPSILEITDGSYSGIEYHVSTFSFLFYFKLYSNSV